LQSLAFIVSTKHHDSTTLNTAFFLRVQTTPLDSAARTLCENAHSENGVGNRAFSLSQSPASSPAFASSSEKLRMPFERVQSRPHGPELRPFGQNRRSVERASIF
jgi:hypothetical protein